MFVCFCPLALCRVQICQSDYRKDLLEWIDADSLPEWLGGRSKGTLLDDVGPWSDPEVLRRMEGQSTVAAKALKRMGSTAVPVVPGADGQLLVMDNDLADGYHSPRCGGGCITYPGSAHCRPPAAAIGTARNPAEERLCLPALCFACTHRLDDLVCLTAVAHDSKAFWGTSPVARPAEFASEWCAVTQVLRAKTKRAKCYAAAVILLQVGGVLCLHQQQHSTFRQQQHAAAVARRLWQLGCTAAAAAAAGSKHVSNG